MSQPELVAALCTALTFACAVQIIITCFLAFAFSQFMSVLHCNLATAAGVLSGLVTVPTVIQLRAAQVSARVGRKYGYTIWYKRLAIGACTILQTITWLCTIINIFTPFDNNTFLNVMKEYHNSQYSKSIVDNIQWFLQCCGARSYKDWYELNWGGMVFDTLQTREKRSFEDLLFNDLDTFPDLALMRQDSVPFSCCAEYTKSACVHQNLEQLGTFTINTIGCTLRLDNTRHSILWAEFTIYFICLMLELTIMYFLKTDPDDGDYNKTVYSSSSKILHNAEKRQFSKFLNQTESSMEMQ